jgi:hypothetical protein
MTGTESIDVSNSTAGVLVVASTFTASSKSRRSLSTKGGYDFQDKVAYLKFSVDNSTTSGNVAELWMYANANTFVQTSIAISPTLDKSISVAYSESASSTPETKTTNCNFIKSNVYHLKLRMELSATSKVIGELYLGNTVICAVSMSLGSFSAKSFFSSQFTYVLSQSSSGSTLKQRNILADEVVSITVHQLGVECLKGQCVTSAPVSKAPSVPQSGLNTGLIGGIIAVFAAIVLVAILVGIIVIAIIVKKKKKKRVVTYVEQEKEEEEDTEELDNKELTKYNAFQ